MSEIEHGKYEQSLASPSRSQTFVVGRCQLPETRVCEVVSDSGYAFANRLVDVGS